MVINRTSYPKKPCTEPRPRAMSESDDEYEEVIKMVEAEEATRNRDLGLDDMDVVRI